MKIKGKKIVLIPAQISDRKKIYLWLCKSDLTSSVMGHPNYPDHPIPALEEFCNEYPLTFFNASGDGRGRVFIIFANKEEVGTISYDLLDKKKDRVVLDIWMKAEQYCCHGYGSDSLNTLSRYIHESFEINIFFISPSARNKRAVAAYRKAGFEYIKIMNKEEQEKEFGLSEYDDNVLMVKRLITSQSS